MQNVSSKKIFLHCYRFAKKAGNLYQPLKFLLNHKQKLPQVTNENDNVITLITQDISKCYVLVVKELI